MYINLADLKYLGNRVCEQFLYSLRNFKKMEKRTSI